jgi:hypothetical protein
MRREPDYFGDDELELVYIAKRLKEALALEDLMTQHAVDYLVEVDTYAGGIIFRTSRAGAFFYVHPRDEVRTRTLLSENGYRPYRLAG